MSKIERKYLAHYVDAGNGQLVRLGKDLKEYSPKITAEVEKSTNILGETEVNISGYKKSAVVKPYYAEKGDPLFQRLQAIIDGDLALDALKTRVIEAKMWEGTRENAPCSAVQESAYIEIDGYGGDTSGYQIAFTIHYTGDKQFGLFDPVTKSFTPEEED